MKKFVFSAVAMMAFSMGSMANNVAVDCLVLEEEVLVVDCYQVAYYAELIYTAANPDNPRGSYNAFSYAYDICALTMDCPTCLEGN